MYMCMRVPMSVCGFGYIYIDLYVCNCMCTSGCYGVGVCILSQKVFGELKKITNISIRTYALRQIEMKSFPRHN